MTISCHELEIKAFLTEMIDYFNFYSVRICHHSPQSIDAVRRLAALLLLLPIRVLEAEVAEVWAGGEPPVAGEDGEQQEGEQEAAHVL